MTDTAKIKKQLEDKLRELTDRAEHIDEDLSKPGDDDWAENAVEAEDDEVKEHMGDMAVAEIGQIKIALAMIEAGTYGVCAACGAPIAKERLAALPYATKCMQCA